MKKLIFTLLLFFSLFKMTEGQITYQHSFNVAHIGINDYPQFDIIDIGMNNLKYLIQDSSGFSLYNLDYSPYLVNFVPPISINQPPNHYSVMYITLSLFDCDSTNLEYMISSPNYLGNVYVYRTDNTLLFERDSVNGRYCFGCLGGSVDLRPIANTPNGAVLFLQGNCQACGNDSISIYSLCGTLPTLVEDVASSQSYVQVFPNPTERIINFNINVPNNYEQFTLTIYNASFQQVDQMEVKGKTVQLDLSQKSLSSGTYLFDLRTNNKVFQTGKFILER